MLMRLYVILVVVQTAYCSETTVLDSTPLSTRLVLSNS